LFDGAAAIAQAAVARIWGPTVKSSKPRKVTVKPKKKAKKSGEKTPDLSQRYREIQWLRDLVEYFEGEQRKLERK